MESFSDVHVTTVDRIVLGADASSEAWGHVSVDDIFVRLPDARDELEDRGGLTVWQRKKVVKHIGDNLASPIRLEELSRLVQDPGESVHTLVPAVIWQFAIPVRA